MKFGKQLETEAEGIPSEWRPYLIQYKALKKLIAKVAEEIESRGLDTSLLHECLDDPTSQQEHIFDDTTCEDCISRIKYYFTGKFVTKKHTENC
jgi:E3 ubiquitin-protein ligase BAH